MIKNKHIIRIALGLLFLGLLGGCGNSKENKTTDKNIQQEVKIDKTASADNFTKVLNDYYSRHCIGIDLRHKLPAYEMTNSTMHIDQNYLDLKKLGLVKISDVKFDRNEGKVGETNMLGDIYKVEMVNGKKIELTEKGKKIYKPKEESYVEAGFCLAYPQVESITNYTKMTNPMGLTIADVKYTVKAVKIVPFLDEVVKIKSFKHFKKLTSKDVSQKAKAELILTEMKGWIHSREFH